MAAEERWPRTSHDVAVVGKSPARVLVERGHYDFTGGHDADAESCKNQADAGAGWPRAKSELGASQMVEIGPSTF